MTHSRSHIKLGNVLGACIQLFLIPMLGISHSSKLVFQLGLELYSIISMIKPLVQTGLIFLYPRMDCRQLVKDRAFLWKVCVSLTCTVERHKGSPSHICVFPTNKKSVQLQGSPKLNKCPVQKSFKIWLAIRITKGYMIIYFSLLFYFIFS